MRSQHHPLRHILARVPSRAPPLPLATRWDRAVGANSHRAYPPISLSCGPRASALTTRSLAALSILWAPPVGTVPPNRPRSPPWTRPRPRVFRPCHHTVEPLSGARPHCLAPLAQLCPQPNTLALSLSPYARSQEVSPLAVVPSPFYGRRRAPAVSVAPVSSALSPATWNASRFTLSPSDSLGPRSLERFLRSRRAAVVDSRPRHAQDTVREPMSLHLR